MKNVAIIVGLLLGGFGIAKSCGADAASAGRIGIAAVFAFTALGHFVQRDQMTAMLPPSVPARPAIVTLSGLLEALLAILVLLPPYRRAAGIAICIFLVLVTPLNVFAAIKKIDFGGHAAGPRYLLLRLPLQFVLLAWTYWFAVRPE
jgi:uncharacterized membrane protein